MILFRVGASAILVAMVASWPEIAGARGHSSGSSHHSSGGSVSVRGYTRKDGTYVAPHRRSAPDHSFSNNWSTRGNVNPFTGEPGTNTHPSDSPASFARTTARTTYRKSARTSYYSGPIMAAEADDPMVMAAEADDPTAGVAVEEGDDATDPSTPMPAPVPPAASPELRARYITHFTSGKPRPVIDFEDEDGEWVLYGVTGGRIKYPKSLVAYFEPTAEALGVVRKWTDSAGSHHVTAEFVRIDGEKVALTKEDGSTIHVPIDKLSEADRNLARRLQELIK